MEIPMDMRLKLLPKKMGDMQPTLMCMLPGIGPMPCVLEVQLQDPENDMKPTWVEVPFQPMNTVGDNVKRILTS